ncbi:type VII secretion integral membrane protein EccD [Segniliparus rugosus]|uniref:Type VII secretion integral membrane protein EccD n=1 Tax=Segniliparus rugosus (strain ATCC BAA-974 / DSM 45345 / CCUG 50838 / CIP 108380 / JCM 13579 / CDC 945) TaxID=679197 RepID=U1M236_SEGRC|nr:type VII secretion integral membrane protein EccD [Segniliparus rugosus]ERG69140.1 type VII secretion integral membrane protein EccD [Segniliparus rugosus ATCC BAA-974]
MTEGLTLPQQQSPQGWESSPSLVRVAVLGDGKLADLALPTDLPLREIIPAVRRLVAPGSADEGTAEGSPAAPEGRRLSLAPLGGAPYSLDATLDAVGTVDGELLVLQQQPAGPSAASVVEDIADAAALEGSRVGPGWNAEAIGRAARATVAIFLLIFTAVAAAWWHNRGGVPARGALVVAAATAAAASLFARLRAPSAAVLLSVVALFPVTLAAAAVVPGSFAAAHALLAAAAALAWSVVVVLLPAQVNTVERATAFFTGAATVALAVLVVSVARIVWGVSSPTTQCLLIVFGLAVTVAAPALSVLFSRLPLPDLPAPGDPLPVVAPGLLADLPRRARRAASLHTGLVAGATLALVIGALYLPPVAFANGWRWYVALAALGATALRARVPAGAAAKTWLVTAPTLAGALGAVIAIREGQWCWALIMAGALGVIAAIWLVVAARPKLADPEGYSLPVRRVVNLFALALDASLIPTIAYVCGVFQWVLAG